jgi:hypothetical protein
MKLPGWDGDTYTHTQFDDNDVESRRMEEGLLHPKLKYPKYDLICVPVYGMVRVMFTTFGALSQSQNIHMHEFALYIFSDKWEETDTRSLGKLVMAM